MAGNPVYVTQSSSGPGTWQGVDTGITPFLATWSIACSSGTAGSTANGGCNIEVTPDNPFSFGSSFGAVGGLATNPSSQAPAHYAIATGISSGTQFVTWTSTMSVPYAWRINQQSSGYTYTVTFLQAGKKQ